MLLAALMVGVFFFLQGMRNTLKYLVQIQELGHKFHFKWNNLQFLFITKSKVGNIFEFMVLQTWPPNGSYGHNLNNQSYSHIKQYNIIWKVSLLSSFDYGVDGCEVNHLEIRDPHKWVATLWLQTRNPELYQHFKMDFALINTASNRAKNECIV